MSDPANTQNPQNPQNTQNDLPPLKRVGVIGAGRMGLPIIGHLAAKGFDVAVHDIDPARQAAVEQKGAQWVHDIAALAAFSDAILICVGFDSELRQLISRQGILQHMRKDAVVALLSTVHPETAQELAATGAAAGVPVLDATVCRGPRAADAGTLLSFVGGDENAYRRIRPVLAAYSTDIVHTGRAGSAQVAKAANNLVLWACLVADHEALALADSYGLDVGMLRRALMISTADNDVLKHWGSNEMAWADDDLEIIGAMAAGQGIALPQTDATRAICRTLRPRRYRLNEYGRKA
ncbi:NAD(P)-dependent oxidoreductase [Oxalobacteraceae bacterium CAVE-383]|nr:NAD(P)-dependent oxidoreductase [Oxalobacteraceae bacterium CAVE-383]